MYSEDNSDEQLGGARDSRGEFVSWANFLAWLFASCYQILPARLAAFGN